MTAIDIYATIRNYKKVVDSEIKGDAIMGVALKWKEVQKVKKDTEEALHKFSKQQLIDFILTEL